MKNITLPFEKIKSPKKFNTKIILVLLCICIFVVMFALSSSAIEGDRIMDLYLATNYSVSSSKQVSERSIIQNDIYEQLQEEPDEETQIEIDVEQDIIITQAKEQVSNSGSFTDYVFYLQYSNEWKVSGADPNIGPSGCGPTSFAMIATNLLKDLSITPIVTSAYFKSEKMWAVVPKGGVVDNAIFGKAAKKWGLEYKTYSVSTSASTEAQVKKDLSEGKLIIVSTCGPGMSPTGKSKGMFTSGGHYITLRGVTTEGKILIGDPNDNTRAKNYNKREFEWSEIINEFKHEFRVFSLP